MRGIFVYSGSGLAIQQLLGFSPAWQAAINPARITLDRMLRETERVYDDVLKEVQSRGNNHEGDL